MKGSIIKKIFQGEAGQQALIKQTKEQEEMFEEFKKLEKEFLNAFAGVPEIVEMYQKASVILERFHKDCYNSYYIEGFKTGLLVGVESSKEV